MTSIASDLISYLWWIHSCRGSQVQVVMVCLSPNCWYKNTMCLQDWLNHGQLDYSGFQNLRIMQKRQVLSIVVTILSGFMSTGTKWSSFITSKQYHVMRVTGHQITHKALHFTLPSDVNIKKKHCIQKIISCTTFNTIVHKLTHFKELTW